MIPWLESVDAFPPLELALAEPNGLWRKLEMKEPTVL